jgi:glycosyltransferase involved in cell wall biosynthesis
MLYPSGGEGFGNPAAESMAAGTPVVYSDYSSHAEFCQFGGLPIRCQYIPELNNGIQRAMVDTNHAIEQLLKLIRDPAYRDKLGEQGRNYMTQFSIPYMIDPWNNIFTEVAARDTSKRLYTTLI